MSWSLRFTRQAQKDARKLAAASPALKAKAEQLLQLLAEDPFRQPPPYEALVGDLHRLMGIAHLIDQGVQPLAGFCRRNAGHQSRASGTYVKAYRCRSWQWVGSETLLPPWPPQ